MAEIEAETTFLQLGRIDLGNLKRFFRSSLLLRLSDFSSAVSQTRPPVLQQGD